MDDDVGHDGPEVLGEFIREHLQLAGIHCELGARHAEVADDIGLAYSARRVTAYMSAVLPTLAELLEQFPQPPSRTTKAWTTEEPS